MAPVCGLETYATVILLRELEQRGVLILCDCGSGLIGGNGHWNTEIGLALHQTFHSMNDTYRCLWCNQSCGNSQQLQLHTTVQHKESTENQQP